MSVLDLLTGVVVGFTVTTALGLGLLVAVGVWRNRGQGN